MTLYKIIRHVFNGENFELKRGLSLEEAREWCNDPETSSSTATNPKGEVPEGPWFDGYTEQ